MTSKMDRPTLDAGMFTFSKQLRSACFVICFCFVLQVSCNSISRRKREDPCPKLQVNTSHGCQPCSLCNPPPGSKLIRSDCQEKHLQLTFSGGLHLWCDHPKGPFPGCPKIHDRVRKSCSQNCKKHSQQYMAGCECLVGCDGGQDYPIQCSRDLQWNASLPFCAATDSLTSSTHPTIGTERTTIQPVPEAKHPHTVVIVSVVLGTSFVIALVSVVAVYCWRSRPLRKSPHSSTSSMSSGAESGKSHHTTEPLLIPDKEEKPIEAFPDTPERSSPGMNGTDCAIINEPAVVVVHCPPIHNQNLLGREQGLRHEKESIDVSFGPSLSSWEQESPGKGKQQQEPGLNMNGEEKRIELSVGLTLGSMEQASDKTEEQTVAGHTELQTDSHKALQALLKDRNALCKVTDFFDRDLAIDKVTWHNLAVDLAKWDRSKVGSMDYILRPSTSDIPGDRPTYKVLTDLEQQAKGLQELITYLHNSKVKHQEAEQFLQNFLENWKKNNIRGYSAAC